MKRRKVTVLFVLAASAGTLLVLSVVVRPAGRHGGGQRPILPQPSAQAPRHVVRRDGHPTTNKTLPAHTSAEGAEPRQGQERHAQPPGEGAGESVIGDREKIGVCNWGTYVNEDYRFELKYPATTTELSENEVYFSLPSGEGTVRIFVDKEPSVLLSGTCGGSYAIKDVPQAGLSTDKIYSEEKVLNGIAFKEDCWVSYGGMGVWETVISCYTEFRGNWYMLSLHRTCSKDVLGALGHEDDGSTTNKVRQELLREMLSFQDENRQCFNEMLWTFRFFE